MQRPGSTLLKILSLVSIKLPAASGQHCLKHLRALSRLGPVTNRTKEGPPNTLAQKFDEVAADIQKFKDVLRKVTVCQPSGVSANNVLSMAIAIHCAKQEKWTMPHEISLT